MIHPAHFGCKTYADIIDVLSEGRRLSALKIESKSTGITLHRTMLGYFKVDVQYPPFKNTLKVHEVERGRGFELSLKGLNDAFERTTQEMYFDCGLEGFQIENYDQEVHPETSHQFLKWRDAVDFCGGLKTASNQEWYLRPITKEQAQELRTLGSTGKKVIEELIDAKSLNLNNCSRAELIGLATRGVIVADKALELSDELTAEREKNKRANKLRESGQSVMTISRAEYEDLFNHKAVLKAVLDDPRFKDDMHHILSTVELDELDEVLRFDPMSLMPKS